MKKERDELRGRFTRFMEVTVRNARIDYLRKLKRQVPTVPLDSIPESQLGYADSRPSDVGFDFEMNACPKLSLSCHPCVSAY